MVMGSRMKPAVFIFHEHSAGRIMNLMPSRTPGSVTHFVTPYS